MGDHRTAARVAALGRAAILAVVRIGGAAIEYSALLLFGLSGQAHMAMILRSAMPGAAFSYPFVPMWRRRPIEVAVPAVNPSMDHSTTQGCVLTWNYSNIPGNRTVKILLNII